MTAAQNTSGAVVASTHDSQIRAANAFTEHQCFRKRTGNAACHGVSVLFVGLREHKPDAGIGRQYLRNPREILNAVVLNPEACGVVAHQHHFRFIRIGATKNLRSVTTVQPACRKMPAKST